MGNCGLSPFGKKPPTGAAAPEAEPEKTEEVVVGETSQTTEIEAIVEATPTETVTTMGTITETKEVTAKVETSTVESEKKEATTA